MPSALAIQTSSPSRSAPPFGWTAKSTTVVVPPWAAAFVPLSKVSLAKVPPNGSSKWVWPSIPPGTTYFPVASMVSSAVTPARARSAPTRAIVSPSTRTSAAYDPSAVTTRPFLISVRIESS